MKHLVIAELRNGPGTCTDIWERLTRSGIAVTDVQVHQALRALVDSGAVDVEVAEAALHMTGRDAAERGVVTYELADGGIWKEVG